MNLYFKRCLQFPRGQNPADPKKKWARESLEALLGKAVVAHTAQTVPGPAQYLHALDDCTPEFDHDGECTCQMTIRLPQSLI